MQYWVIDKDGIITWVSSAHISVAWLETIQIPDWITVWWKFTWETFVKWEELIKKEKIEEFNVLKKQITEEQNNEMIKWILEINQRKWEVSSIEDLKIQITDLYNELIKKYWEDIKNELF